MKKRRSARRRVEYGDLRGGREKERNIPGFEVNGRERGKTEPESLNRQFWDRERPPHWG